jgi:tetratricopeptide (TPR) repeat protein
MFHFSQAVMLHNQGNLDGVVTALKQAIEFDDNTLGLRLYLAEALMQLGRVDEAVFYLEDIIIDDPDSIAAHRMLGDVLLEQGQLLRAADEFRRLTELMPGSEEPMLLLVQTQARLGKSVDAIDTLKRFVAEHPESFRSHYALARMYRQIDLTTSAEKEYRKVIELQPRLMSVYGELGEMYEKRRAEGDLGRAIDVYRQGLSIRATDRTIRHRLVTVLLWLDRYAEAQQELEVLLDNDPDDLEALRKYGLLQMEQESWPDAMRTFERLLVLTDDRDTVRYYLGNVYEKVAQPYEALREFLQISPEAELYPDARIHAAYLYRMLEEQQLSYEVMVPLLEDERLTVDQLLLMASLAVDAGQSTRALQFFQKGEERFPGNTRIVYQRGTLLEKLGMYEAARMAMKDILEMDPYNSEAMNFIAYQYAEEGTNLEEALKLALRAIELNEAGHIFDTLGWVLYRLGRYSESLAALQTAVEEIPDDPIIHEHLGDVQRALKAPSQARRHYLKSLELDPSNPELRDKLEALQ